MIFRYLKIWLKVISSTMQTKSLFMTLSFCLILLFIIYFLTGYKIGISVLILLLVLIVRQSLVLFVFYKKLLNTNQYDFVLLKPVDTLVGIIVFNKDPLDIIILLPILVTIKFRNFISKKFNL